MVEVKGIGVENVLSCTVIKLETTVTNTMQMQFQGKL